MPSWGHFFKGPIQEGLRQSKSLREETGDSPRRGADAPRELSWRALATVSGTLRNAPTRATADLALLLNLEGERTSDSEVWGELPIGMHVFITCT